MDSKLIQGLLVGSCLLLLFASFTTLAEYLQYGSESPAITGTGGSGAPPAGRTTAPPAAAKDALTEMAPAGAVGYIKVNVATLVATPLMKSLTQGQPTPVDPQNFEYAVAFVLFDAGAEEAELCGIVKIKGTAREEITALLEGTPVTVEGMEAYASGDGMIALADDTTLLAADSQANLARMIKAFQGSGRGDLSGAQRAASAYASDMVQGGFVLTDELRAVAAGEPDTPAWVANAQSVAFGLSLTDGLSVRAAADLDDDAAAQQAATDGAAGINQMKQEAPFLLVLLNAISITADGSTVRLDMKLGQADLDMLVQGTLMPMLQGMMMGGAEIEF